MGSLDSILSSLQQGVKAINNLSTIISNGIPFNGKITVTSGTIDNVVIGSSTPSSAAFTAIRVSSNSALTSITMSSLGSAVIGSTVPSTNAILTVRSSSQGVQLPQLTTTQKNSISVSSLDGGLMVFDTTLGKLAIYTSTAWQTITST